jgi:hypothetical protein
MTTAKLEMRVVRGKRTCVRMSNGFKWDLASHPGEWAWKRVFARELASHPEKWTAWKGAMARELKPPPMPKQSIKRAALRRKPEGRFAAGLMPRLFHRLRVRRGHVII